MKKRFTIEVDIDTERSGVTLGGMSKTDKSQCSVMLRKDLSEIAGVITPSVVAVALAHELGHIVGYQCDLLHTRTDPRFYEKNFMAGISISEAIINSEKEAWDLAEIMFSLDRVKKIALKSYEESYT